MQHLSLKRDGLEVRKTEIELIAELLVLENKAWLVEVVLGSDGVIGSEAEGGGRKEREGDSTSGGDLCGKIEWQSGENLESRSAWQISGGVFGVVGVAMFMWVFGSDGGDAALSISCFEW